MPQVEFTEDLITGIDDIDRHHRAMVAWANRLLGTEVDHGLATHTMAALVDYIAYHFAAEEEAMVRLGYEGLEKHRAQHQRIAREAERLQVDVAAGLGRATLVKLQCFVEDWFFQHIRQLDGAFAQFVRERGAAGEEVTLPPPRGVGALDVDALQNVEVVHAAGELSPSELRARLRRG